MSVALRYVLVDSVVSYITWCGSARTLRIQVLRILSYAREEGCACLNVIFACNASSHERSAISGIEVASSLQRIPKGDHYRSLRIRRRLRRRSLWF